MTRFLITGGAGFIGSHVADALVARGDHVTLLDDLSTGTVENVEHLLGTGQTELVSGSVLDSDLVDSRVSRVDVVVHLAATVGVQLVVWDPLTALKNNVLGTETVLEACSRYGTKVLITSTSEIYGKNTSDRLTEEADRIIGPPTKTRWAYATSKVVDEIFAYEFHRQKGLPAIVARLFNTSGPRQTGAYGMVIPRFVQQALAGEELTVFGNGAQTRCFCHVDDTVSALLALLEGDRAVGGVFNVGATDELSIGDLARRVIDVTDSRSGITHLTYEEAYEPGFEDMQRRIPDTTRIQNLVGWFPRRSIDDIILDVVAYERQKATIPAS